jgi:hypothetical protein
MLVIPGNWLIDPDLEYCSFGGRLKSRSATMSDLDAG